MQVIKLILFFFLSLINFSLQLKLKEIPSITKTYIESLKKISKFKVFEHHLHPFKDYTTSDIQRLLGLKEIDPSRFRVSQRRTQDNKIDVFGPLTSKIPSAATTYGETSTSGSTTTTSTYSASNMVFGADVSSTSSITYADLPVFYMVTNRYPACGSTVKNQGRCASCYAMAITETLADRICVYTNMQTVLSLSPQVIISCDSVSFACQGGYLDKTFDFLRNIGTVEEKCFAYSSGLTGTVPKCPSYCADGSQIKTYKFQQYKKFLNSDEMKMDIYNYGPITTGFAVYNDFLDYQGGVYQLTNGSTFLGGHAVKVIGWGKENGIEFWIAKNSWGTGWGEAGFFRFAMNHCCSFDLNGIAALPLI